MTTVEHLLVCLMEECAEIQYAAAKALRFGLDDTFRPDLTPRQELRAELADLVGVVTLLRQHGALPPIDMDDARGADAKIEKLRKMMDYARTQGTLEGTASR